MSKFRYLRYNSAPTSSVVTALRSTRLNGTLEDILSPLGLNPLLEHRYLQDAIDLLQSRHARVIVASQTPDNPYAIFTAPVYVQYAADVAIANHLPYLDHFHLLLVTYYALGADETNSLFPLDQHVHTSPEGLSQIFS